MTIHCIACISKYFLNPIIRSSQRDGTLRVVQKPRTFNATDISRPTSTIGHNRMLGCVKVTLANENYIIDSLIPAVDRLRLGLRGSHKFDPKLGECIKLLLTTANNTLLRLFLNCNLLQLCPIEVWCSCGAVDIYRYKPTIFLILLLLHLPLFHPERN